MSTGGSGHPCSASVAGSLYLLIRYASRVYARFRLPPDEVITGRFTGEDVIAGGKEMGGSSRETRDLSRLISKEQAQLAQQEQQGLDGAE
mgnify:CR=1 FL=1